VSRPKPKAHLWVEDGGMVTGCDDPAVARPLLLARWYEGPGPDELDDPDDADLFPLDKVTVQRGRIVPVGPQSAEADEYAWLWKRLTDDATGRGVTTAVVWQETR
jgi:hypothetical protein